MLHGAVIIWKVVDFICKHRRKSTHYEDKLYIEFLTHCTSFKIFKSKMIYFSFTTMKGSGPNRILIIRGKLASKLQ